MRKLFLQLVTLALRKKIEDIAFISLRKCYLSSSTQFLSVDHSRWGGGVTKKRFIQGGSAPMSNPSLLSV